MLNLHWYLSRSKFLRSKMSTIVLYIHSNQQLRHDLHSHGLLKLRVAVPSSLYRLPLRHRNIGVAGDPPGGHMTLGIVLDKDRPRPYSTAPRTRIRSVNINICVYYKVAQTIYEYICMFYNLHQWFPNCSLIRFAIRVVKILFYNFSFRNLQENVRLFKEILRYFWQQYT